MGNIHSHSNNYSERFPLGDSSVVALRKTKIGRGREVVDTWSAQYCLFGRTNCELDLTKHEEELSISIHDHASDHPNHDVDFRMDVRVKEDLLLGKMNVDGPTSMLRPTPHKSPIPQGGVLKSSSILYGLDTDRKGLIVMLRARTRDDDEELPYMITVMHCFVAARCSHGVTVVVKIRSSGDGGLSVEIEKPSTQHKRDLLSMFDDVKRKGYWLPNPSGSDCAIEPPNQSKNSTNTYPFSIYSIRSQHDYSSRISNAGYINGNGNGSIIRHQHYYISGQHNIYLA